jgi:DNA-binding NarL/FixJ family response regulator
VIDDHYLVRQGLHHLLQNIDPECVFTEAESLEEGIAAAQADAGFDLVLLDLGLPGCQGISAVDTFYASVPDARVVVVSATYDLATVQKVVARGVLGFVPKLSSPTVLANALKFVLNGGIYVPRESLFGAASETAASHETASTRSDGPPGPALTPREREVLQLVAAGESNKGIARLLGLSPHTVKRHVARMLDRLGLQSRQQAAAWYATHERDSGRG